MSFDNDNMLGGFTELEIAAGVPGLAFGKNVEFDGDEASEDHNSACGSVGEYEKKLNDYQISREAKILKASNKNPIFHKFKCNAIKMLLEEDAEYIVSRYAKKEGLSDIYVGLIWQDQCILVLVKGMLGKVAKINLSASLVREIESVVSNVIENPDMNTPYQRVGEIQKFIHGKIDETHGVGSCLNLPVKHMRNLLSAARLHLGIKEVVNRDARYLNEIIKKSRSEAEEEVNYVEEFSPSGLSYLLAGKNFYPKWRVKHLKHISYYSKESTRKVISGIEDVDGNEMDEVLARHKVISKYIFHDPRLT